MASIEQLKGSDGSGNANLATVQSSRAPLASTIIVDTVLGINPSGFSGSMGTPHTFIDPVTSEEITVISEATCVDFTGHIDGSNIEIDDIAPGYTDAGSEVGDVVIIRPTTQYSDNLAEVLEATHNDDGTLKTDIVTTAKILAKNVTGAKLADGIPIQKVSTEYPSAATGATQVPFDDTIPQKTEGDEYMTQAITPLFATSVLEIEALFFGANSAANDLIAALFRDTTADAIGAQAVYQATPNGGVNIKVRAKVVAGSTSATTFKLRAGGSGAGTTTFNGTSAGRKLGAISKSYIKITEIRAS